jgi:hypothetical protein
MALKLAVQVHERLLLTCNGTSGINVNVNSVKDAKDALNGPAAGSPPPSPRGNGNVAADKVLSVHLWEVGESPQLISVHERTLRVFDVRSGRCEAKKKKKKKKNQKFNDFFSNFFFFTFI